MSQTWIEAFHYTYFQQLKIPYFTVRITGFQYGNYHYSVPPALTRLLNESLMPLLQSLFFDANYLEFIQHLSSLNLKMGGKYLHSELARAVAIELGPHPQVPPALWGGDTYVQSDTFVEQVVLYLLNEGADPNAVYGEDSDDQYSLFMDLISTKSLKVVKKCIEKGGDVNYFSVTDLYDDAETTLLDLACETTGEIVNFLLENGAMETLKPSNLNIAIKHGTLEIVQLLVLKGIRPKMEHIWTGFDQLVKPNFATQVYKEDAFDQLVWLLSKTWDVLDFQRIQTSWDFCDPKITPERKAMALQAMQQFFEQRKNFFHLLIETKTISNRLTEIIVPILTPIDQNAALQ